MNVGQMRSRISFEEMDATGPTWNPWLERWAEVVGLDSDTYKVRCRYVPGLDENKHRIIFQDIVLEIRSVVDVEQRHHELDILAVRPLPNGPLRG